VRDPAGPGDTGQRLFDAGPHHQLVPAGVHHTNTETERPQSILPRPCVVYSGRGLAWARCRRSSDHAAGAALSGPAGRRSATGRRGAIRPHFVSPPPIPALRDLTATGALVQEAPGQDPAGCRGTVLISMASALLIQSRSRRHDGRNSFRSGRGCTPAGQRESHRSYVTSLTSSDAMNHPAAVNSMVI
jgi:hypothetical protein